MPTGFGTRSSGKHGSRDPRSSTQPFGVIVCAARTARLRQLDLTVLQQFVQALTAAFRRCAHWCS